MQRLFTDPRWVGQPVPRVQGSPSILHKAGLSGPAPRPQSWTSWGSHCGRKHGSWWVGKSAVKWGIYLLICFIFVYVCVCFHRDSYTCIHKIYCRRLHMNLPPPPKKRHRCEIQKQELPSPPRPNHHTGSNGSIGDAYGRDLRLFRHPVWHRGDVTGTGQHAARSASVTSQVLKMENAKMTCSWDNIYFDLADAKIHLSSLFLFF